MGETQKVLAGGASIAALDRRLPVWATPNILFWLLLLAAAAINLIFGFAIRFRASPMLLEADELEYYDLATRLLTGTMEVQSRRTLGYPFFLAAIRLVTSDFWSLQVISALFYAFAPPFLFLVARRVVGSTSVGFAAGFMLLVWPPAIFYGTSLYSETAALPLFLLVLLLIPLGSRLPMGDKPARLGVALIAGLVLGFTTHVRTMYQLFLPVIFLILVVEEPRLRIALARFAVIALAWLAVILPWSIYLTKSLGHPILVTSNGGETLAGGLTPQLLNQPSRSVETSDRTTWVGPGKWLSINENGYLSAAELRLPLDLQDKLMQDRAKSWAIHHPATAAYLELCKVLYMWGFYPLLRNGAVQVIFGNIPTLGLLAVSLFSFLRMTAATRVQLIRFWILPLFATGIALISWGSWRFRMPGDAGLLILCAYLGVNFWFARRMGAANESAAK